MIDYERNFSLRMFKIKIFGTSFFLFLLVSCAPHFEKLDSIHLSDTGGVMVQKEGVLWVEKDQKFLPVITGDDRIEEVRGHQVIYRKKEAGEMHVSNQTFYWSAVGDCEKARFTDHWWLYDDGYLIDSATKRKYHIGRIKNFDLYENRILVLLKKEQLQILTMENGKWVLKRTLNGIVSFLLSDRSPFAVVAYRDGRMLLLNLYQGQETLDALPVKVLDMDWLISGKTVVVRGKDKIFFLNLKTRVLQMGFGEVMGACLSEQTNRLYLLYKDSVDVLDYETKSNVMTLRFED